MGITTSEEPATSLEPETCAWCGGRRAAHEDPCPVCGGKGAVLVRQPARVCPRCHCTGRTEQSPAAACAECGGSGWAGARAARRLAAGRSVR